MKLRIFFALVLLQWISQAAFAQVSIGIGLPSLQIGVNVPVYPELRRIPDYPAYYAPGLDANYFFYDGMYWIFQGDSWYASSWYNGPWELVNPADVPDYVLRIPVGYYVRPPTFFFGWPSDAAPRWGDHWGAPWAQRRGGWDRWDRHSMPAPAAPPAYQREYSGGRYPQAGQQAQLQQQHDRYQPRDPAVHKIYEIQRSQPAAAPARQTPGRPQAQEAPRRQQQSPARAPDIQRAQPQAQLPQRDQEPRGQPPVQQPQRNQEPRAQPQVQQAQRGQVSRAQPQGQQPQHNQEPRAQPQGQQPQRNPEPRPEQGRGGGEAHEQDRR